MTERFGRFPQEAAVADRFGFPGRVRAPSRDPSGQSGDRYDGPELHLAGAIGRNPDLLGDDRGGRAAGEGHDLNRKAPHSDPKTEGGVELGGREVVGLTEIADGPGLLAHPDAVDRQIAGQRIGGGGRRLDPALRMGAGQAADKDHAGEEGDLANPQANQAVAEIGRQVAVSWPRNGFGIQRRRRSVIHLGDAPQAFFLWVLLLAPDREAF
ncbi:hypothetical protein D3C72_734170 [compost metagenome]